MRARAAGAWEGKITAAPFRARDRPQQLFDVELTFDVELSFSRYA